MTGAIPGGRRWLLPLIALGAALAAVPLLSGRREAPATLAVTVTVPPQAWLLRRLGGDRVSVGVLIPPGTSVHTYEPTPQQMRRASESRLLVEVGHPALLFERRLLDGLGDRPGVETVSMAAGVEPLPFGPGEEGDPHVWLSPAAMRYTAGEVAAALERLDPAGAPLYRDRLAGVLADLDRAAAEARRLVAGLPQRRVVVYHPAWGYLLRELGLEQVALEAHGKEPSPRQLVALLDDARRDGVRQVFVQRGFSDRPARVLAAELGAEVVEIDPLAEDWAANLPHVAARFREALGG